MRLPGFTSVILSIVLHTAVFALLVFNFSFIPEQPIKPVINANIVKAVAVDNKLVEEELKRLKDIDEAKQKKQAELEQKLKELQRKTSDAEKKRKREEKRLADARKKKALEESKRKQEEKRLAALKKEQSELEKKRKEEEERKRKAEEERKRQEELKKKKEAEERKLAEQKRREAELAEEQRLLEETQARQDQGILNQYVSRISRSIIQEFNTSGLPVGLTCVLQIRMIPGGEVVEAQIAKSSGNDIFDRRAETAVKKASPLPVPENPRLFEKMRELRLTFAPN